MYHIEVEAEHGCLSVDVLRGIKLYDVYVSTFLAPGVRISIQAFAETRYEVFPALESIAGNLYKLGLGDDAEKLTALLREFDRKVVANL